MLALGTSILLAGPIALFAAGGPTGRSDYALVQFEKAPLAGYDGDIPGYQATKAPAGTKLDAGTPAAERYAGLLGADRANFRAWARSNAPQVAVLREFSVAFNGVAVELRGAPASALAQAPGVVSVTPSWLYRPSMDLSVGLVKAPPVWSQIGASPLTGNFANLPSVKVGVIDTGILDTHPFIASCRPAGSIKHDVFFSGLGTSMFGRTIVFDHGTHVAGTIGGCPVFGPVPVGETMLALAGPLTGVAPGVTLHDYNVFPGYGAGFIAFGGSAFSHDIIAAIEASIVDGMDVINLSLGGLVQGPHDTLAEAINFAAMAGVVPVVAGGNSGPRGASVESPGNAAGALTAGASTNPHYMGIQVFVAGLEIGAAIGDFENFDPAVTASLSLTTPANGCTAIQQSVAGKLAVIDRGVCTFGTKIRNAQAKGAIGVIIVNNVAGDPIAMGADTGAFPTIPAAMVSKADEATVKGHAGESAKADGTSPKEYVTTNADIIAGFSGRGPTPYDFRIKPDVTAPGVNVLSSVFLLKPDGTYVPKYEFFQGTSMSTPHTAGAAALLLAAHPEWSPADVKSALVNAGDRTVTDSRTGTQDAGVLARGGGRINIEKASLVPVTLDPVSMSFGLWTGNKAVSSQVQVTFKNLRSSSLSCSLSMTSSSGSWVALSTSSLTIGASGKASVTATLNGGMTIDSGDYSGDLVADCGGTTLKAPWWTRVSRSSGDIHGQPFPPGLAADNLETWALSAGRLVATS